ncbi:MFS transporter [Pararobbsia alpina]|uniref:Putative transport protein HsrA n=1 Tax=Pararobbsia alpina TaxID=621374 RepID=A0A6S7B8J2_9BURK|nr:MFS transporter [Pararobbsia alpina]CAB3782746.1 putative transport protein HsrA [Pararobbsia alpina]
MTDLTALDRRSHRLALLVAATFFMEYLDTTVVATALPQMAQSFHVGPNDLSMGMSAYMLALAVFIPVSGWIADRFGTRTVFAGAIALFTIASVLCGLSNSTGEFTAARLLQGLGGAMMVPVGRMIVVRNTDKSRLIQAISTITWPAIMAPVIAPPLGGFITDAASWRWIFLINVPLGLIAIACVFAMVRNERDEAQRGLDLVGFLLSGGALVCLMCGTELASRESGGTVVPLSLMAAAVIVGVGSYWHAARHPHPLVDYALLKVPTFSVTVVSGSLSRVGINAVPYLMPLLFQIVFGMSAFRSGLILLVSALGNFGMKALTTPSMKHLGFRLTCLLGVGGSAVFTIACGLLRPDTLIWITLVVVFMYGAMRSLTFSTLATLAYVDMDKPRMGAASTIWSTAQQMTIGMGIAFGALSLRGATLFNHGGGGPGHPHTLVEFRWAFFACGIVTLLSLPGFLRMARDAGHAVGGGAGATR